MPAWLKFAGVQASGRVAGAALGRRRDVVRSLAGGPGAVVARAQVPVTCAWSTRVAGFQLETAWQASQVLLVARCVAFLPVAFVPSWQLAQFVDDPGVVPLRRLPGRRRVAGRRSCRRSRCGSPACRSRWCRCGRRSSCRSPRGGRRVVAASRPGRVAGRAAVRRLDVRRVLAGRRGAVVAGEAAAGHLRVIDARHRAPAGRRVAGLAGVARLDVGAALAGLLRLRRGR